MSWQTQKNKHSFSPAMKYILSNRAVPFWIYRVGESKAQNKQHSDLDLSAITVCDRLERTSFGSTAKTRALIDTIPRPQRSLPFNKCPFQQLGPSSRRQQGTAGEAHVHVLTCLRWLLMYVCSACVCVHVLTCSRFQSRTSAMPKYLFSFGPACLKKMSGFRIKSLSGGI